MSKRTYSQTTLDIGCQPKSSGTIYTCGHSTRSLDEFLAVLRAHGITVMVDVRSHPSSKRYPHFDQSALRAICGANGSATPRYVHIPKLGGHRYTRKHARAASKHKSIKVQSFASYADYMESDEFEQGISELLSLVNNNGGGGSNEQVAFFCAEAVWWRCHRRMIADVLTARGWNVVHLGLGGSGGQNAKAVARSATHALWDVARIVSDTATDEEQQCCADARAVKLVYDVAQ